MCLAHSNITDLVESVY